MIRMAADVRSQTLNEAYLRPELFNECHEFHGFRIAGTMRPIAFAIVTAGALLTHAYRTAVSGIAYQASVKFFLLLADCGRRFRSADLVFVQWT